MDENGVLLNSYNGTKEGSKDYQGDGRLLRIIKILQYKIKLVPQARIERATPGLGIVKQ